jgi:hypothetical protein
MTCLATNVSARHKTRIRDVLLACFIALAAVVAVSSIAAAADSVHAQR